MLTIISIILTVIGALNWLLVGALGFNLVTWIFGATIFSSIIYILVGIAGIYLLCTLICNWHRYSHSMM